MNSFLIESGNRARRPAVLYPFVGSKNTQYFKDIEVMHSLAETMVANRRKLLSDRPELKEKKDLLNALLLTRDEQTGEGLTDQLIIDNMITFLVAGHETTSGTLSFTFYFLLSNPRTYRLAQEEVDRVCGRKKVTVDMLSKLPYINAVLRVRK